MGDFAFYDQVLDMSFTLSNLPERVAEACGVDVAAAKAKANMRVAETARKATVTPQPDAPKADLPQHPAARAGGDGGRGNAKKGKKPVAQAGEVPKTSAAHASAQIAEALQELEGSGAKAQGNKAAPVAAKAAHGLPPASEIEDDFPYPDDDAKQPAGAQAATVDAGQGNADTKTGATLAIGSRVQVNESATGKKQKPWIGYCGTIAAQVSADAWDVDIERAPRCKPLRVCFLQSELEAAV